MEQCTKCGGFIPSHIHDCPHCNVSETSERKSLPKKSPLKKWRNSLLSIVGGGTLMLTMMACYGPAMPICQNEVDNDKDGFFVCADKNGGRTAKEEDCNDSDKTIHPNAKDTAGDKIDQNCDGVDG